MDKEVMSDTMKKTYNIGMRKIGSVPPSCEHKCYGCTPCEAVQVPSTSSRNSNLGLQYSNYEPESWKCKCGPSLYSPWWILYMCLLFVLLVHTHSIWIYFWFIYKYNQWSPTSLSPSYLLFINVAWSHHYLQHILIITYSMYRPIFFIKYS